MIAWLDGTIVQKQAPVVVLNVNGVGYELEAPMTTFYELPEVGETVQLYAHLVVREDAQLLFGFISQTQRDLFRALIRISGVGPKVALAILSTFEPSDLIACVNQDDVSMLTKVPGIGAKTAQRLMVDLKSALERQYGDLTAVQSGELAGVAGDGKSDACAALIALGYKQAEVNKVVRGLASDLSSEQLIRDALKILSGRVL
jgi:Holliday junction DNA helicase RuvA